jgi:hypothetical protein
LHGQHLFASKDWRDLRSKGRIWLREPKEDVMNLRLTACFLTFLFSMSPALADQFNVNLSTDVGSPSLLLSVTDMNIPNPQAGNAYNGEIDPGHQLSVAINGASGNGHIQWSATTTDRTLCGSGDVSSLSAGNNVTVSATNSGSAC